MTNPFTAFAFPTTGATTNRTLPDRLQDIHNVKDFGAVGDWNGTSGTDNWAHITACFGWNNVSHTVATSPNNKVASFTGVISAVPTFQGSISGSTLTAAPTIDGTLGEFTLGPRAISSYTYNSTTGEVDLTMSGSVNFNAAIPITVQGLNINGLNIPTLATFASGTSVKYTAPTGLSGVASGGGSLIVGGIFAVGQTVNINGSNSFVVNSYTYNSTTGVTVLTLDGSTPASFNVGDTVNVSGLALTNPSPPPTTLAGPNGSFVSTAVTSSTITYTGPTSLVGTVTGGGSCSVVFTATRTIASFGTGTGGAGTYNLNSTFDTFTQPFTMVTNCILVATSVSGTIAVADSVLNNSGTDASPNVVVQNNFGQTKISSQQSGTTGGAGTYILSWANNFLSQSMFTASSTIVMNTTFPNNIPSNSAFISNANNASTGHPSTPKLPNISTFDGTNVLVISYINGIYSLNDTLTFMPQAKGTIYLPPGNYFVSKPILLYYSIEDSVSAIWQGDWGGTTITGSFPDYILKRTVGSANFIGFEKLNIVNNDPNGGGIRSGGSTSSFMRDITVSANRGISNFDRDSAFFIQQGNTALDHSFENCSVTAGANFTNSIGLMINTNAPVINCRASGCAIGFLTAGGEGSTNLFGCYIENCGTALVQAQAPSGEISIGGGTNFMGGWIKNCGQGIAWPGSTTGFYGGIRIEGTNGHVPPSATNPQYGIIDAQASGGGGTKFNGLLFGVVVTGQYDVFAISLNGQSGDPQTVYAGVSAFNTGSGQPYQLQAVGGSTIFPYFVACNTRPIYPVTHILTGSEGDQRDVNDSNTSSWSATAGGSGTTHALVRWNSSNWTVMGI